MISGYHNGRHRTLTHYEEGTEARAALWRAPGHKASKRTRAQASCLLLQLVCSRPSQTQNVSPVGIISGNLCPRLKETKNRLEHSLWSPCGVWLPAQRAWLSLAQPAVPFVASWPEPGRGQETSSGQLQSQRPLSRPSHSLPCPSSDRKSGTKVEVSHMAGHAHTPPPHSLGLPTQRYPGGGSN